MTEDKKIIYYVDPATPVEVFLQLDQMCQEEINTILCQVKSLKELYYEIFQAQCIDTIAIDVSSLHSTGQDLYTTVTTLRNLIKNARYIDQDDERDLTEAKIMLLIDDEIDRALLREALEIEDVYIGFRIGGSFTVDDIRQHTRDCYTAGGRVVPKKIRDLLKPKKIEKSTTKISLTPRQNQIYRLISTRGASNKAIAKALNISESTVKLHISAILKKYGVRNRTQLAVFSKRSDMFGQTQTLTI